MDKSLLRPGRGGYVVAAVVLIVGMALAGVTFATTLSGALRGIEPFASPGSQSVEIEAVGSYTIYVADSDRGSVECTAIGPGGDQLALSPNLGSSVTVGGGTYVSWQRFDVDPVGTYQVDCTGPDTVRLAVGPGFGIGGFVGGILGVVGLAVVTPLLAGGIWLATLLRRSASANRIRKGLPA